MSWAWIPYAQGKAIESVCKEHFTDPGYRDEDCPTCPIRDTCRMELPEGNTKEAVIERGKIFELAMAKAVMELKEAELLEKYPELAMYCAEDYRLDLTRDDPELDGPDFEIIFNVMGERYYCFLHGTTSILEALGLFFQDNPHITYDMIEDHMEV